MTTSSIPHRRRASSQSIDPEQDVGPRWRLGLVTDRSGHVHVGASIPASSGRPAIYLDLLAAVGAACVAELDLDQFWVIVQGERVADMQRIIAHCIDDARLRQRLLELVSLSVPRS